MAIPQQKMFRELKFATTKAIVAVQRAFGTEFGIDAPHVVVVITRPFPRNEVLGEGRGAPEAVTDAMVWGLERLLRSR